MSVRAQSRTIWLEEVSTALDLILFAIVPYINDW